MKLSDLLTDIPLLKIDGSPPAAWLSGAASRKPRYNDPDITSIHYRSQEVKPGGLFVAIEGGLADGHDFVDDAIQRGASAIVCQKSMRKETVVVEVANTRRALSQIAAAFYRRPSDDLFVIGITGTNGKTTTAYLIESILQSAGYRTGVIGTINYRFNGRLFNNPVTTPESLDLQMILSQMLAAGVTHVVLEVSSHAIDLHRADSCSFNIGIFTNLTQDHLDYHVDMDAYWACKKKFFTDLLTSGPKKNSAAAVINCGNRNGRELATILDIRTLTTGRTAEDIRSCDACIDRSGISGSIATPAGELSFSSDLIGDHNLDNILAAVGVGVLLDIPLETISRGLAHLPSVPGRLERIHSGSGRYVYVDYAHTPDALENVLGALRPMTDGRLICVFGCGGDRDRSKRPLMGRIAGSLCDLTLITSDNPRTEPPLDIIAQIQDGIRLTAAAELAPEALSSAVSDRPGFVVLPDRRQAIETAITLSRVDDTILIAGKGHETYQIVGKETLPFDDREEAMRVLGKIEETQLTAVRKKCC